ncbi:hypothetical protein [Nocardiopsis sp. CC223A]|uniref:hypothetical protein n=1 Tax=Nocardiopsis sp. CC223A TaxID=3044051 RepID=UPI00278C4765|nr:hypothetical protein [Nocardiopsis sp. CC223A]
MNPSPMAPGARNGDAPDVPVHRKRPPASMNVPGFSPVLWTALAFKAKAFPTLRSHTVAMIIADAVDRDGRWCFMSQATLVERAEPLLSLSTAKRALDDLVSAGIVRKLPREQVHGFFAPDLAAGRMRADNLPDVLELLIPASAYTDTALERINEARALLGEEPLTPANRPDLPTAVHPDLPRPVSPTPRDSPDRPTDPHSPDPRPHDPSPDPVRGRVTPGSAVPRPRTAPDAHRPGSEPPRTGPEIVRPVPPRPPVEVPETGTRTPWRRPPAWALDLLRLIPDAALRHPERDRAVLARKLSELRAAGVGESELGTALAGWQDTARPFAALRARLACPETVRAWNTRTLLREQLPSPSPSPDAFARRLEFTVDGQGRATGTCPAHPSVRNVPGGTCCLCGGPCRGEPGEVVHPPSPGGGALPSWLGPPDADAGFTAPKCDDERCNPDRDSPRYRTVPRLTADGRDVIAVPCPACGRRVAGVSPAAA